MGPDEENVWLCSGAGSGHFPVLLSWPLTSNAACHRPLSDCELLPFSGDGVDIGRAITAVELTGTFKRNRDKYRVAVDSRELSLRQLLCL